MEYLPPLQFGIAEGRDAYSLKNNIQCRSSVYVACLLHVDNLDHNNSLDTIKSLDIRIGRRTLNLCISGNDLLERGEYWEY